MKVTLINGSPHQNGCTHRALEEIARTLEKNGISTQILWVGSAPIASCRGCGGCRKTGQCVIGDALTTLLPEILSADGLVFGSPVHFASASGALSSLMDRLFYSHTAKLRGKPACAVFSCRRGGASASLDQINKYFNFASMPIVSGQYWNMVHGTTPQEVEQDLEGLQIMRSLGENMAWLLHCIQCGKEQGYDFPTPESPVRTNFIR